MKRIKTVLFIFGFMICLADILYAKDITIIYTGQTHAMLYPCSCPISQDGGVSRRATLVKELRKKYPKLLLLDCGSFTAGGLMDEYTQSTQLDIERSLVNFKAMELMQYDAVGISPDEFNFGKDFFLKNAKLTNPAYLSANLDTDKVVPYIIKEIDGVKIGIIGLTGLAANLKAEGLKVNEPKDTEKLIGRLRKEGAQVVMLLSTLGEKEDLKLISEVKGIDILFIGQDPLKGESLTKIDNTFVLRPSWQGRKLGRLTLEVKAGKLWDCKLDEQSLTNKITGNAQVDAILPRCFSDANCKQEGLVGSCQNPGTLKASCLFSKPNKVHLLVISAEDCAVCNINPLVSFLKKKFPGIEIRSLNYSDPSVQKLVKDLAIQGLPAYIFGREVEKEDNFDSIKDSLQLIGNTYLLKSQASGISYFFDRQLKPGSFDLFLSLFEKYATGVLTVVEEFKPTPHFMALETNDGFSAKYGAFEVEEYLRGVCVQKYYPQKVWDYLICRSKNINTAYWEDCLSDADVLKVKSCARGPEGVKLLKENILLNKELEILAGPSYLLDNRVIFSSRGTPNKEELRKIIKKQRRY
jgi:hypothetical protein